MATPSAKAGAQNASTPQSYAHLNPFSSPAPRSVPSPATVRNQAGKSPFNAGSTQQTGTASANSTQNHPTVASSGSGPTRLLENSPAGILPGFDSPGTMLPSLSNMGFVDGGVGMGINISRMSGLGGRGGDEERRKRLDAVISLLKSCPSRLSPESLEILGQRQGLASLLDPSDGPRKDGSRECHLAAPGETVGIEIKFLGNKVIGVDLTSLGSSEAVEKHIKSASEALRKNLTLSPMDSPMVRSLNKFNRNLERLAKLDKLNSSANSPNFNCFEAITGVYTSLKKLFDHEKKVALALIQASKPNRQERAERETMCKKSGRPLMNARDNIGLSLDYWMHRRHIFPKSTSNDPSTSSDSMDIDAPQDDDGIMSDIPTQNLYSLNIECESMTPGEYVPVRISDAWISDQIEKPSEHPDDVFGPVLEWQEPPPTYLTNSGNGDGDAMSLETNDVGKLPNIRFVAKLDPPLPVPLQIATNILASTGSQQDAYDGLYHNLVLDIKTVDPMAMYGILEEEIRNTKCFTRPTKDGESVHEEHYNILHNKNAVLGKLLDEIPFSHPKQLIQILPTLRQWAFIGTLIQTSFLSKKAQCTESPALERKVDVNFDATQGRFAIFSAKGRPNPVRKGGVDSSESIDLSMILENGDHTTASGAKSTSPSAGHVTFDILANGDISIVGQNIVKSADTTNKGIDELHKEAEIKMEDASVAVEKVQTVARSLDISGDLDIWVSWMSLWSERSQ